MNKKILKNCGVILIVLFCLIPSTSSINLIDNTSKSNEEGLVYKEYYPGAPFDDLSICYYQPNQVIIKFDKKILDVKDIDEYDNYPVLKRSQGLNAVSVEYNGNNIHEYIENLNNIDRDEIEYAELNFVGTGCNDPHWNEQWGHQSVKIPEAWKKSKGRKSDGTRIVIAILDTGLDFNHEDINADDRVIYQYDVVNQDTDASDDHWHGTFNAGLIIATHDNNKGIKGIAPDCNLVIIKVLDENNNCNALDVADGIYRALEFADIISMSLAFRNSPTSLITTCNNAYNQGAFLVAATGNEGLDIGYPAKYESVMAVGAIKPTLKGCDWSNVGPELELVGPGVDVISTLPNNKYEKKSGTSYASTYVAGVAALIMSSAVDSDFDDNENKNWENHEIRQYLMHIAFDLKRWYERDIFTSHGLVQAIKGPKNREINNNPITNLINNIINIFPIFKQLEKSLFYKLYLSNCLEGG